MNKVLPIRILLVDDHHIFNDGLKRLIEEQPNLMVCGQVYQAKQVMAAVEQQKPDLLLLDINLQGSNGIDLGKKILASFSDLKIIVLTMYNQPKLLEETKKAGLHGYLLKDATTAKLLEGIQIVISGKTCFDHNVVNPQPKLESPFLDNFAQRLNLTFREIEVIRLIKIGFTNEQIAERLNLSFFTVKTHRKNIHFKLKLNNVAELIEFAVQNGI